MRTDGREVQIPVEQVRVGDRIVVKTGEKISVDGVIEEGEAAVDQASITGEFMPMHKQIGDPVFAGTVVKAGHLTDLGEEGRRRHGRVANCPPGRGSGASQGDDSSFRRPLLRPASFR